MNSKVIIFLVFGLFLLVVAGYGYLQATPPATENQDRLPKVDITPQNFDFGEIKYGDIVSHKFTIKNLGNEILKIKRIATSCSCTSAEASSLDINPNETAELLVTYDTGLMVKGPHGIGKQQRVIYIKTNDPVHPQIEVTIEAVVK